MSTCGTCNKIQRAADLIVRGLFCALIRFRRQEELFAVSSNPIPEQAFGLAVTCRGVNVIDTTL